MTQPVPSVRVATFGAATTAVRVWQRAGRLSVTAIVKVTYQLTAGVATLSEPLPIVRAERHHLDSPVRSIRVPNDVAPYLPMADVVFAGHAHSPDGSPSNGQLVRLTVARDGQNLLDKSLCIVGNRLRSPESPHPQPDAYETMPIALERTYGGSGVEENLLGVGRLVDLKGRVRLPNIHYPDDPNCTRPAYYGAIAAGSPTRARMIDPETRFALGTPGVALDSVPDAYFQVAPFDQRLPYLIGTETLRLSGLLAGVPHLETRLPGAVPHARAIDSHGRMVDLDLRGDLLFIDGDLGLATLTFRAVLPIANPSALAGITLLAGVTPMGAPIHWPDPAQSREDDPIPNEERTPKGTVIMGGSESAALGSQGQADSDPMRSDPPPPMRADAPRPSMGSDPGVNSARSKHAETLPLKPDALAGAIAARRASRVKHASIADPETLELDAIPRSQISDPVTPTEQLVVSGLSPHRQMPSPSTIPTTASRRETPTLQSAPDRAAASQPKTASKRSKAMRQTTRITPKLPKG